MLCSSKMVAFKLNGSTESIDILPGLSTPLFFLGGLLHSYSWVIGKLECREAFQGGED